MKGFLLSGASIAALAAITLGSALAQDDGSAELESAASPTETTRSGGARQVIPNDEIIVSASRAAAVSGFNAPTPTTVISADVLDRQGVQNIGDVLQQVPAYRGTKPESNGVRINAPGTQQANLRGLGIQRTLVLVNSQRMAPFAPSVFLGTDSAPAANLNSIPPLMIERTEIVTGGASAQWGSDAMGGVINVILRDSFDGFKATASAGVSAQEDYKNKRYGFIAGRNFAEDRGNILIGADYADNKGVGDQYERDWGQQEWSYYGASASDLANGLLAPVNILPNVKSGLGRTGLILPGTARDAMGDPVAFTLEGFDFTTDGTAVEPYDFGEFWNGFYKVGGEGKANNENISLVPPYKRWTSYAQGTFDLTDSMTAKLEASYSFNQGNISGGINRRTDLVIHQENPFLPASVATAMMNEGVERFTLSRIFVDIGNVQTQVKTDLTRLVGGLQGKFGNGWNWDAYYQYGLSTTDFQIGNSTNLPGYRFAIDAVDDGMGNIVCRESLSATPAALAEGCVPLNAFGEFNWSPAAKDYVTTIPKSYSDYTQQVAAANVVGQPFSLWAGPVSMAVGVEYRKEEQEITANEASTLGLALFGNTGPWSGDFDVKEAYIDTVIPLAEAGPLVNSFDLSAALRVAEYSSVGNQTSWKFGVNYSPIESLSFRYVQSQDVRAPQIFELFAPGSPTQLELNVLGGTYQISANTSAGNPNLGAETAESYSIGGVWQPSGILDGLQVSVDYYNIDISDAILNFGTTTVASRCNAGIQSFCDQFTYNSMGEPIALLSGYINAATYNNVGVDYVASYSNELADIIGEDIPGTLSTNITVTNFLHAYVRDGQGSPTIDRAGENSENNFGSVPDLRFNWSTTYGVGPVSVTAQIEHVSEGEYDTTFNDELITSLDINNNHVKSATLLNLYGTVNITENVSLFGSVENVMDRPPAISPNVALISPVNGTYYDKVGRRFRGGITLEF